MIHRLLHLLPFEALADRMHTVETLDVGPRSSEAGGVAPVRFRHVQRHHYPEMMATRQQLCSFTIVRAETGAERLCRVSSATVEQHDVLLIDIYDASVRAADTYYVGLAELVHQALHLAFDEPPCAGDWRLP